MGEAIEFHDRLASLCGPEISAALRGNNPDRAADMITALATMLGRTIARATGGNPAAIDTMLTAAEDLAAAEAAGMAGVIGLSHAASAAAEARNG